jgi:hypothetical protein
MPVVKADRVLDLAEGAMYPHLARPQRWWANKVRETRVTRRRRRRGNVPIRRLSLFTWSLVDGGEVKSDQQPIGIDDLRMNLNTVFTGVRGLPAVAGVGDY